MDTTTEELLPGVNIILTGTNFGAATDFDGKYSIDGIPPANTISRSLYRL